MAYIDGSCETTYKSMADTNILTKSTIINDTCVICFEEFSTEIQIVKLQCGHGYHKQCISKWTADKNISKCPICSETLRPQRICFGDVNIANNFEDYFTERFV